MKYFGIVLMAMLVLASCTETETNVVIGNKTTIEIEPMMFDAGDVLKGEMVDAKFTITNTGTFPLVIAEVKGGCSCTVADYPDEPIQPGESGVIWAHVNTDETGVGALNKGVTIVANTDPSVSTVVIRGNVMRK
ncbi:MAG: DUF1573 domain-containing protein [Crocinitomicaceae bacterium]|nr:DUF1573 domain-containing protein [Crocinitomicaceae bacterium]